MNNMNAEIFLENADSRWLLGEKVKAADRRHLALVLGCWIFLRASAGASAPEWPQFRGPDSSGIAAEANPPVLFGPEKNVAWKTPLPAGGSSPIVSGDRIFLTGFSEGKLETLCVSRRDGAILWRRVARHEKLEAFLEKYATPAASTCATDGERVVSYFGSCGLVCHDLEGRELWTAPLPTIETREGFGTGSSPILHDGVVYLLRDEVGKAAGLYAFDVRTGRQLWLIPRAEFQASYSTPVLWDGCVVTHAEGRAKGYDLKTGRERWLVRGLAAYPCSSPTVGADGNLYLSSWSNGSRNEPNPDFAQMAADLDKNKDGALSAEELAGNSLKDFLSILDDNHNGLLESSEWDGLQAAMRKGSNAVLCVRPGGTGDITDTHIVWMNERGAAYVASPLAYQGRLFIARDGGFATAYEMATGKMLYEKQRLGAEGDYYASPVAADGRIYVCSTRGVVIVLKSSEQFQVLARNDLAEPIAATPALVGDSIYLRTATHLWAFRARAAQ